MGDIDQNQFQPNSNDSENEQGAFQGSNVDRELSVPYGEAPQRHHLSTYTDDEKRWLVIAAEEERSRGTGFMLRLKRRWDQRYPQKKHISKQNLRDNAARFKKEITINNSTEAIHGEQEQDTVLNANIKWTNEMKINLLKIEESERKRGRGFMKRMKDAWDAIYGDKPMSAQTLRDNAVRFRKNSSLLSLLEVRDRTDVEPEVSDTIPTNQNRNANIGNGNERDSEIEFDMTNEVSVEVDAGENQSADVEYEINLENLENVNDEDDDTRSMRLRFMEILHTLTPTTKAHIDKRERLPKIKKEISNAEFIRANAILEKYLHGGDDICKVVDKVYAMARTIEERSGLKWKREKMHGWKGNERSNRRIRKSEEKIKGLRQILAWTSNEIYRRTNKRRATEKEKNILQRLRDWHEQQLLRDEDLKNLKEKTLDELRYRITKLKHVRARDARIRNNRMFEQDQGKFYRGTKRTKLRKGKVPIIEKFEEFWAGIWEDNAKTPHRRWMNTVARRIREKVTEVQEFTVNEQIFCEAVKKRKNWSAPGLDGIQNFWWKKLRGSWKAVVACFQRWVEQPDAIPEWITEGRTVLLPKSEDLSSERDYRPITCLNTCYKLFTSMIASYMKDHADRNGIWDKSQLGTCTGVLGTVDQLIVDNAIMDEVRNQKRHLVVAFYDYQKAYDMVRHDWMIRVYKWMGVPEKVISVISKLMDGWKTRLEVTENGKTSTSRIIHMKKGFLQGDSYSPVGFCLTEVPVAMLIEDTDGYMMGKKDEARVKRTHSLFVDDLKIYQENHQKLEVVNEMIVKASMDTGACYGVKKCAEVVFSRGKMIKGEGLIVLEDKMEALDPSKNEIYKFLGCEQGDKIDVKRVMERVKKRNKKEIGPSYRA